ncbi:hypothetical protein Tco_0439080 [Tanacetum coccineum]
MEEVLLPQVHHEFLLWEGCNRDSKSRYNTRLAQLLPRQIYSPCVMNWDVLNRMGCDGEIDDILRIRLREAGSDEEIFTSVAWIRAFNTNEPIYTEICHEYQNGYANVTWLIARWMKRKGAGTQKESQICCGQFISKISRKCRVLTEDVVRSLSAPIYCRDLDTTTLRDLIESEGTDTSKITRKQSKSGKLGHENQKSTKRSQRIKAEARKVKPQSKWSNIGQQK